EISQLLQQHLERVGHAVRTFLNAADVISCAERMCPSLFVVDTVLSDVSGFTLCRNIRKTTSLNRTPIVLLGESASEEDRIVGLEWGADDYIGKPFSPRETVARIRAVLRRFNRRSVTSGAVISSVLQLGDIRIDSCAMTLSVRGNEVITTTLEFRLMEYLARHQARVFTRDQLLDAVWGDTQFVTPRTVDACVRRIRKKIEPDEARPS